MKSLDQAKLLPVLRRPRRHWQIPIFQRPESLAEEQQKEARLKAFAQGTTPYGREIFRRSLDLAWKLVEQNKSLGEAAKQVAEELETFWELRSEFVLLLARTTEVDPEGLGRCSVLGLAMQIVLRARVAIKLNEDHDGEDSTNDESDA